MSLSKYSCSCSSSTNTSSLSCSSSCCNNNIQTPPQTCCETHNTQYVTTVCFYPSCDVVATDGTFYITFLNACSSQIPLNVNDVYLYHAAAGLMRITGFDGRTYSVQLVDTTKAGAIIQQGDCILVSVQTASMGTGLANRCLYGTFLVPAIGASGTIYILNGSGIPVGATITFTYNGETGSYTVDAFLSVNDNIYAYTVTNTGNGHTAGIIIDGGCDGACIVPIEVISDVDVCNLSESEVVDNLTGCLNGSPRAYVSVGEDYVPTGDGEGGWSQKKIIEADCCIVIDDCLKFSGNTCPDGSDQVIIRETNLTCFEEAWDLAVSKDQNLPIYGPDGLELTITAYDAGTRTITVEVADPTPLVDPISYGAGDEFCLGDCCSSCLIGPQITNHKLIAQPDPEDDAVFSLTTAGAAISAPVGFSYYLIGFDQAGVLTVQTCDAAYFAAPSGSGPDLPAMDDALAIRQKICNTSPTGCDQVAFVRFNYELYFYLIDANIVIDYEFGHFAQGSATLADGVTPNPFSIISTQNQSYGRYIGPSVIDGTMDNCSMGVGGSTDTKVYPVVSDSFIDYIELRKCDCAKSILWFFVRINNTGAETIDFDCFCTVRRQIIKYDWNLLPIPKNDYDAEGFNN